MILLKPNMCLMLWLFHLWNVLTMHDCRALFSDGSKYMYTIPEIVCSYKGYNHKSQRRRFRDFNIGNIHHSFQVTALQWHHNGRNGISHRRRLDCLLSRLLRRRSKKTAKPASLVFVRGINRWQRASNAENVSIWWRHHGSRRVDVDRCSSLIPDLLMICSGEYYGVCVTN